MKDALPFDRLGIAARNAPRPPMGPATTELEKRLDSVLIKAGLLPAQGAAK